MRARELQVEANTIQGFHRAQGVVREKPRQGGRTLDPVLQARRRQSLRDVSRGLGRSTLRRLDRRRPETRGCGELHHAVHAAKTRLLLEHGEHQERRAAPRGGADAARGPQGLRGEGCVGGASILLRAAAARPPRGCGLGTQEGCAGVDVLAGAAAGVSTSRRMVDRELEEAWDASEADRTPAGTLPKWREGSPVGQSRTTEAVTGQAYGRNRRKVCEPPHVPGMPRRVRAAGSSAGKALAAEATGISTWRPREGR